jgi:hypothetical protein
MKHRSVVHEWFGGNLERSSNRERMGKSRSRTTEEPFAYASIAPRILLGFDDDHRACGKHDRTSHAEVADAVGESHQLLAI